MDFFNRIFIIFLIIISFTCNSFCAVQDVNVIGSPNYDVRDYLTLNFQRDFDSLLYYEIDYARNNNNTFDSTFLDFCNHIVLPQYSFWLSHEYSYNYFYNNPPFTSNSNRLYFGYVNHVTSQVLDDSTYILTPSSGWGGSPSSTKANSYSCSRYSSQKVSYIQFTTSGSYTLYSGYSSAYMNIPDGCSILSSQQSDTVHSIIDGSFSFISSDDILTDIKLGIDEMNQTLSDIKEFFEDTSTDDYSSDDLPNDNNIGSSVDDYANGVFSTLYNAFTIPKNTDVNFKLPFMNYEFTLSRNYIRNGLTKAGLSWVRTLISTLYHYFICSYIIKDVFKLINAIRNGDIAHTDSNIKIDML